MIKKIGLAFGALLALLLIVPAFLSSHFSMSRSIEIQAPVATVFAKLTDLNEYNKWNPFPEGDPSNQTSITGQGIGSSLTWKGDKTGEGKMTLVSAEPEKKIAVKMDFYKPMSGEGMVHWLTVAKNDTTTEMTWTFDQDLPYLSRYFGLMMDSMMGKHFEKGLMNFKSLVEAGK